MSVKEETYMVAEYAVYKGEEIVAIGTIKELAKKLNVQEKTIKWYSYANRQKRRKNGTVAVRIN